MARGWELTGEEPGHWPLALCTSGYERNTARTTLTDKSLQTGGDIHGVAKKVVILNDDVADVDADPKSHLLTRRPIGILLAYSLLHSHGTLHGIHSAGEIGDEAVARCIEDPTAMRGDQAIDYDPVGREGAKGADLIEPH